MPELNSEPALVSRRGFAKLLVGSTATLGVTGRALGQGEGTRVHAMSPDIEAEIGTAAVAATITLTNSAAYPVSVVAIEAPSSVVRVSPSIVPRSTLGAGERVDFQVTLPGPRRRRPKKHIIRIITDQTDQKAIEVPVVVSPTGYAEFAARREEGQRYCAQVMRHVSLSPKRLDWVVGEEPLARRIAIRIDPEVYPGAQLAQWPVASRIGESSDPAKERSAPIVTPSGRGGRRLRPQDVGALFGIQLQSAPDQAGLWYIDAVPQSTDASLFGAIALQLIPVPPSSTTGGRAPVSSGPPRQVIIRPFFAITPKGGVVRPSNPQKAGE